MVCGFGKLQRATGATQMVVSGRAKDARLKRAQFLFLKMYYAIAKWITF